MVFKVLSAIPSLLGLKPPPQRILAENVFIHIAAASRQPIFYAHYRVPDTMEGRFDMVSLHMISVIERVREKDQGGHFSQALFDAMVSNLDANFREMGVGDTKVGKKVRERVEVFYGQAKAYREALEADDDTALREAISRNIFGTPDHPNAEALADYLKQSLSSGSDDIFAGKVPFPALTGAMQNE